MTRRGTADGDRVTMLAAVIGGPGEVLARAPSSSMGAKEDGWYRQPIDKQKTSSPGNHRADKNHPDGRRRAPESRNEEEEPEDDRHHTALGREPKVFVVRVHDHVRCRVGRRELREVEPSDADERVGEGQP